MKVAAVGGLALNLSSACASPSFEPSGDDADVAISVGTLGLKPEMARVLALRRPRAEKARRTEGSGRALRGVVVGRGRKDVDFHRVAR